MKASLKNTEPNLSTLLPENCQALIKGRAPEAFRNTNYAILSLFWKIGTTFNKYKADQNIAINSDKIAGKIAALLQQFGPLFNPQDLLLMGQFAKVCSSETLQQVAAFISWKYIPHLVHLNNQDEWIFYTGLVNREHLTPAELAQCIDENVFGKNNRPSQKAEFPFADLLLNTEDLWKPPFENYFIEPALTYIRPLLEPANKPEPFSGQISLTEEEQGFATTILSHIQLFQNNHNQWFNVRFNLLFWELGTRILELFATFQYNPAEQKSLKEDLFPLLEKKFGNLFNELTMESSLKFAGQVGDFKEAVEIATILTWEQILLLLQNKLVVKNIPEEDLNEVSNMIENEHKTIHILKKGRKENPIGSVPINIFKNKELINFYAMTDN